jgi:PAS domain S-box-containing protein
VKVLAIEDSPADVEMIRELLSFRKDTSFDLENARTLSEAAAILARGEIEFILLDLGLPDSQGIDTLRAVSAISNDKPIVVLTGFDDDETGLLTLHEGAQDYLVKGRIDESTLVRAIRYATERNKSEQELVRKNLELDAINQALRESDERFRTLADFTNDWEEWIAPDKSYLYISPSCEHISGYSAAEFTDDPTLFSRIIHPEDRPIWDDHLREAISDRKKFEDINFRIIARDGTICWISHYCQPVISGQGAFLGIRSSNRDITERKDAEIKLLHAHRQLLDLIDFLPEATFAIDRDHRVIAWNQEMEKITGISKKEMLGRGDYAYAVPFYQKPRPMMADLVMQRSEELEKSYDFFRFEGDLMTAETYAPFAYHGRGGFFWGKASPMRDSNGTIIGAIQSIRDISERKDAEKTLLEAYDQLEERVRERTADLNHAIEESRKERQRLYEVLETLPVYVCLLNPDYHVPFANQYFREAFGESHGKRCYEFLFDRTEPCETCESYNALKNWAPHHWYWTGPNGRDYDIYDFPFTDTDGSRMVLEMGIDITEQKTAQKLLQEAKDTLEVKVKDRTRELEVYSVNLKRSNEDLERFAYVASHDLREPLRMVTSFSQLLEKNYKGRLDADADEFIGYIVDGGKKMDALITDLLEYSRITSQGKPFEPTDMNMVLGEAQRSLSMTIEENKAKIEVGTLPTVNVDRVQMALVFQNLLSNAIKFHEDNDPVVTVSAAKKENEWIFSVRDNGIGIAPDYHEKIFELFQRLHSRDDYHGTGIGLAICKRVVERHGGRIWVESEPGKGSTFFFTLPDGA